MSNSTHFVQYFNIEKMGRFPNGADALLTTHMGVYSKLAAVQHAKGGTVYVISGYGKPKKYVLWEAFTIEDVVKQDDQFVASGPGKVLLPPAELSGKEFDTFKSACANFVGFRKIDDQKYTATLKQLAEASTGAKLSHSCVAFCDELIKAFPKMGDAHYYRGHTKHHLGDPTGAKPDLEQALKLGTNFPDETTALLTAGTQPATTGSANIAAQVVSKGVFAAKPPAGVSEVAWRGVLQRRGAEDFRQKVLAAYGGKCAVSGADAEAALEVALIDPEGPNELKNALLLRADLRTLFDLNLLRIHPKTRKVFLASAVQNGAYARLWARTLRPPESRTGGTAKPDFAALEKRWSAAK